jgi:hypothetical protein
MKASASGRISRLSVAQVAWAACRPKRSGEGWSRPCALARVHGQDARATLLAIRARAGRNRQLGDAPGFLQEGGIIRLQVKDRVKMSINLDQARAVSLKISTQMLEVSEEVLEDGAMHQLR